MDPMLIMLILKYGVPLAIRLIKDGKDDKEATQMALEVVENLATGDIKEKLLDADKEQTEFIINALYGALQGLHEKFQSLITTITSIGQPTEVKK